MHVWATPSLKLAVKRKLRHCLDTLRRGPQLIIAKRYLMKLSSLTWNRFFFHLKSKMLVKLQVIDHYFLVSDSWCFLFPGLRLCGSTCLTCKLSFFFAILWSCWPDSTTGIISFTGCFPARQLLWFFVATWQNLRVDTIFWMGSGGHNSAMCWQL